MANIIEKALPSGVRNRLQTLIAAGLGLFLGLQYNDYVKKIVDSFFPPSDGLLQRGLVLIGVTIVIVYASVYLEKMLDGK